MNDERVFTEAELIKRRDKLETLRAKWYDAYRDVPECPFCDGFECHTCLVEVDECNAYNRIAKQVYKLRTPILNVLDKHIRSTKVAIREVKKEESEETK